MADSKKPLAILSAVLRRHHVIHYIREQCLTMFLPMRPRDGVVALRPSYVRSTVREEAGGILFTGTIPLALRFDSREREDDALVIIAKENYGSIRGALTYDADSGTLSYRLFHPLPENPKAISGEELSDCARLCVASLANAWNEIQTAQDSKRSVDEAIASAGSLSDMAPDEFDLEELLGVISDSEAGSPLPSAGETAGETADSDGADEGRDDGENGALADDIGEDGYIDVFSAEPDSGDRADRKPDSDGTDEGKDDGKNGALADDIGEDGYIDVFSAEPDSGDGADRKADSGDRADEGRDNRKNGDSEDGDDIFVAVAGGDGDGEEAADDNGGDGEGDEAADDSEGDSRPHGTAAGDGSEGSMPPEKHEYLSGLLDSLIDGDDDD